MGSRSFAQAAPTSATTALNAAFTGYGGHSLLTPHFALKQLWWTDARIKSRVTRTFIINRLTGQEREFLDRPVAFGDGLTDDTYMEWILQRARRLFLILAEIGLPDQIFGCVDDAWDDDDLPVPLEAVPSLELSAKPDRALDKRFYDTQFIYLLRELRPGSHIDYGPKEHIPMELVNTRPPAVSLLIWDRVHLPGKPDEVYMRRKYALSGSTSSRQSQHKFMQDVQNAQRLTHEHISPVWASYTSDNAAYILSDFVGEHTLATFMEHRLPTQFQRVPASERPLALLKWMHCLADALASLHHSGIAHTAIRPSNILVDHNNRIAFADVGSIRTFQRGKKGDIVEVYDYAAPESQMSSPSVLNIIPPASNKTKVNKLRKWSTSGSSSSSSAGGSQRSSSIYATSPLPPNSPSMDRPRSAMTGTTASSNPDSTIPVSPTGLRPFTPQLLRLSAGTFDIPQSPLSAVSGDTNFTILNQDNLRDLPVASPQMSDVYSLACVFLDISSFIVKGRIDGFVRHRKTRVKLSPPLDGKTERTDTSFHYDPEKVVSWIEILQDECEKHREQIYRGIPEILQLVRRMQQQNATLRPTALEVRDEVQRCLVDLCGLESLCCIKRSWQDGVPQVILESPLPRELADSACMEDDITAAPSRQASNESPRPIAASSKEPDTGHQPDLKVSAPPETQQDLNSEKAPTPRKVSRWRKAFLRSS